MKLGDSTPSHLDVVTPQLHVLAGGQVDGPRLGIPGQHGHTQSLQRFALRPHGAYDQLAAMKFALQWQNPPVAAFIVGPATAESRPYPASRHSLLAQSNPNVLLWALKPHDDGIEHGVVLRLWNQSSSPQRFVVSTPARPLRQARRLTHIETPVTNLVVNAGTLVDTLPPQGMRTYGFKVRD